MLSLAVGGFAGLVLLVVFLWSVFWSYGDANRRGKPGILVALLVFFLSWPLGLILWLVFRPPLTGATRPLPRDDRWKAILGVAAFCFLVSMGSFAWFMSHSAMSLMPDNPLIAEATQALRDDPEAVALIGEPVQTGLLSQGSISIENGQGDADLAVPVSGPRGEGVLRLVATRAAGQWVFQTLQLEAAGRQIDLLGHKT